MLKRFFLRERNMMAAILINTVIISLFYFPEVENKETLELIDHAFLLLFVLEALVKIYVLKPKAYFRDRWNVFDFSIVVLSLPSLLMYFVPIPNTSVLLILRVFRLIRLIRFMRFIPHIGMVLSGLGRAIKASVFVLLALVFLNFMLALVTCHFYGSLLPDRFGNPLLASYTIFQLFTVEGWHEIPTAIAEQTNNTLVVGISRIYFVLVVLIGGIFGMSLANAVFVDEMTMDNNRVLEDKIDRLQEQVSQLQQSLEQGSGPQAG